jgi:hypothetical protein
VDAKIQSQLQSLRLKSGEIGAEAVCVTVSEASDQPVALGVYTLKWKRYSGGRNCILILTILFLLCVSDCKYRCSQTCHTVDLCPVLLMTMTEAIRHMVG